jgi:hypothetical protein
MEERWGFSPADARHARIRLERPCRDPDRVIRRALHYSYRERVFLAVSFSGFTSATKRLSPTIVESRLVGF